MVDYVGIAWIIVPSIVGVLFLTYAMQYELVVPQSKTEAKPERKMKLVRCHCDAATKCPQGRDVAKGDYRCCSIWMAVEEKRNGQNTFQPH